MAIFPRHRVLVPGVQFTKILSIFIGLSSYLFNHFMAQVKEVQIYTFS